VLRPGVPGACSGKLQAIGQFPDLGLTFGLMGWRKTGNTIRNSRLHSLL
jgi:hypothetical protein